jgi:glycosyltransferase involved in cell wall biosynthesis
MAQTYPALECIIVDDASPDDSILKCDRILEKYDGAIRFHILYHDYNRGLSAARNTGTDAAIGDYIFYLDSDDEIPPDCIEKLVYPISNDASIEMVMGNNERRFDGCPLPPNYKQKRVPEQDLASLKAVRNSYFGEKRFFEMAWNKLIKKDFIIQHKLSFEEGLLYEDLLWTFFVLKHLSRLYVVSDVTYFYYKRPQSIWTGTSVEDKRYHYGRVYDIIANSLTEEEKGREADYYFIRLSGHYIQDPKNPAFIRSAQLFRKALADDHYTREYIIVTLTIFMFKTALGRGLFKLAMKVKSHLKKDVI